MSRSWTLQRPNGDIRSANVQFNASGRIEGYDHPNEASWAIRDDRLLFLDYAGVVTATSNESGTTTDGAFMLTMSRDGIVAHRLRENLATDRSNAIVWADGDRFRFRMTSEIEKILSQYRVFSSEGGASRWKIGEELTAYRSYCIQPYVGLYSGPYIPEIGSFSYMYSSAAAFREIGRYCSISWNVRVMGSNHPLSTVTTSEIIYQKNSRFACAFGDFGVEGWQFFANSQKGPPKIGNDVWIGQDVTLSQGITLGTGCVIAAGAVVTKDVQPYEIVGGVPAKHIRFRFSEIIRESLLTSEWWQYAFPHIAKFELGNPEHFLKNLDAQVRSGEINCWKPDRINLFDLVKDKSWA